ncbi:MBL fold metallo-hydrolase, partial [Pseudomonadales bacterium]|nr:MBL fold metallo-hydrolase [Pseudomonadales bacterium]
MQISRRPITKLALTNQGALDLVFLGVGSAFSKTLNQTNLFIVKDQTHLLIDCGNHCPHSLFHDYNTPLTDIDNFLITHSHADHVGGLEEAQLAGRYVKKRKPTMIITQAYEKILW